MSLVNGLPAHILLVHFVIVLVPLTALALVAGAIWPAVARRMGIALPLLALVTLLSVPLASEAGEWLERHVESNALVRQHAELGDGLLPWAGGLFALAVGVWWTARRSGAAGAAEGTETASAPSSGVLRSAAPVQIAAVVLSLVVAAGAVVDVYRIGDSGAKAAWQDGFSQTAVGGHGED
ncbi:DUF2231 domain-containing protein [Streptomyces sp. NPDC058872]|uniref:DUF2231 domain-containing protein n=1 Tax=Streptomyces sp. NPDC058872 TaxID=3346661 RepID=UPI00367BDEA1